MIEWFDWIRDEKLHKAAELTRQGEKLPAGEIGEIMDLLAAESEYHIKRLIGERSYEKYFPTDRHGGDWKPGLPHGVVDHYTAGVKTRGTLLWFSKMERKTSDTSSAHFVIDRDGVVMQIIDPRTTIAWHARRDSYTHVGIEHANAGLLRKSETSFFYADTHPYPPARVPLVQELENDFWEPYTSRQIVTNVVLKRWLIQAIPTLQRQYFVDHQALDPKRKRDCGPLWPLRYLNDLVFSWKPVGELESLKPAFMTKNAVAVFNEEVRHLLET